MREREVGNLGSTEARDSSHSIVRSEDSEVQSSAKGKHITQNRLGTRSWPSVRMPVADML